MLLRSRAVRGELLAGNPRGVAAVEVFSYVRAVRINEHYAKLPASYLFPEIGRRVRAYRPRIPTRR